MIERLVLLGVSHHSAPLAVRERIARLSNDPRLSLARLRDIPGVSEGMLLSTCNRVEIYGAGQPAEQVADGFRNLMAQEPAVVPHLYERRGEAALRHLFRVASSLDSMVVGEPQILGQLKEAYALASRTGTTGDTLHRAVGRAFAVAKRVRSETSVGRSAVSMVHAAIELGGRVFDTLVGKSAVVLGAGEMGDLAARRLLGLGVAQLVVANRTLAHAGELVARLTQRLPSKASAVRAAGLEELPALLVQTDLVIAAAEVTGYLVSRADLRGVLRARRFRPLLFVDLAVPRAIDPEVQTLENVYLKDVDDIGRLVTENTARRSEEAVRAEGIIDSEVQGFARVLRGRAAVPVLAELRRRGRRIGEDEVRRTLDRIGGSLDEAQRQSVEAMAQAIVNKILHEPTARLRAAGEAGEVSLLAEAAGELFGLEGESEPE